MTSVHDGLGAPVRRWHRFRAARLAVVVLVTAPLVFSALYMWMMWDPTKKVPDMPVALVNSDAAVVEGGKSVDAGAGVAQNLMDSRALDFDLVDSAAAGQGLRDGKYYFVIEIPEDFSARLAALGTTADAPAMIDVIYNDNNTLMASNIGARAMSAITAAVLKGVAATTVGTVLDGVNTLGQGLIRAAEGSTRLHEGTTQLATGADQLAVPLAGELAPGVSAAAAGSAQLADGASQLSTGISALSAGTDQLGTGATQLSSGIDQLVDRVDPTTLLARLDQLQTVIDQNGLDTAGVSGGLGQVSQLLTGLQRLQTGGRELASQLSDPQSQYRSGITQLTSGAQRLDEGAAQLVDGMTRLDEGTRRAADGAIQLQSGAHRLDDGAAELSAALQDGTATLPDLGDTGTRASLASLLSTPVTTETSNLAVAKNLGPGAAPLALTIASALIPILVCMSFRSSPIARSRAMTGRRAFLRRACAVIATNLVLVTVVGLWIWHVLTPAPTPESTAGVIALVAAATLTNVTIVGALFTVLGFATGTLTSLALLMLQLFAYGGVWMIETVPAPFQWLHPFAPMTYVRNGLIATFNGTGGAAGSIGILLAVTVVAGAANIVLNARGLPPRRTRTRHVADDVIERTPRQSLVDESR